MTRQKKPKYCQAIVTVNEVLALREFVRKAELPENSETLRGKVQDILDRCMTTFQTYEPRLVIWAQENLQRDGEIEIDSGAVVSRGDDPGAYIAAWVWVADEDVK